MQGVKPQNRDLSKFNTGSATGRIKTVTFCRYATQVTSFFVIFAVLLLRVVLTKAGKVTAAGFCVITYGMRFPTAVW